MFLLLAGLAFAEWEENVTVRVVDAAGKVVPEVVVAITYQRANANTQSDGRERGLTNLAGEFSANLVNRVPAEFNPSTTYQIAVESYFWSEKRTVESQNASGRLEIFTAPIVLDEVRVSIYDTAGFPIPGAVGATTEPYISRRTSDSNGFMSFLVSPDFILEGAVGFGDFSIPFRSTAQSRQIPVRIPILQQNELNFTVLDSKGGPLGGVMVRTSAGGQPIATSEQGIVRYRGLQAPVFDVYFSYGGIYAKKTVLVSNASTHMLVLPSLLNIAALSQERYSEKCVKITAEVFDPRPSASTAKAVVNYTAGVNGSRGEELLSLGGAVYVNDFCVDGPARAVLYVATGLDNAAYGFAIDPYSLPLPVKEPLSGGNQSAGTGGGAVGGRLGGSGFLEVAVGITLLIVAAAAVLILRARSLSKKPKLVIEEEQKKGPPRPGLLDMASSQARFYGRCLVKFVREAFKK